jgi:hypothetical protein
MRARDLHQRDLETAFLRAARAIDDLDYLFGRIIFTGHYARISKRQLEKLDEAFRGKGEPLDVLRSRLEDAALRYGREERAAVQKVMAIGAERRRRRQADLAFRQAEARHRARPAPGERPAPVKPLPAIWQHYLATEA